MVCYAGCDMCCICKILKGMKEPGLNLERSTQHSNQPRAQLKQHDANMVCYAGCEMWCIFKIWQGMTEPGLNMEIQVCHLKGEMISLENDIKNTGIGCTVWNWQAKQIWHNSAINSTMPTRMQQETKLLHSNIATKHMAVIYSRWLTKDEHWAMTKSQNNRFKQAWQKCKRYQHHRLSKNTNMPGINIKKQSLEQDNNTLKKHNIANKGMAWIYSKHIRKVPYWQ